VKQNHFPHILSIVLFTAAAFVKTFDNGWTTWDDNVYVIDNPYVRSFSTENLKTIWSTHFNGSYLPLTMMSYMVDYAIGELNPVGYHAVNLFFHIINTALVYILIIRLSNENRLAAFIVAIIFGIHPMHVESVAWVSARKDVLCGFFCLLSLIAYLHYVHEAKQRGLILSFLFFSLALFSKVTAMMLPLLLLLIDWYHGRKWHVSLVTEKFSFFIVAALFVLIGLVSQKAAGAVRITSIGEMILIPHYSLYFYLEKFFLPMRLSSLYPYPTVHNGFFPVMVYAAVPIVYGLAYVVWKYRTQKTLIFGVLFFVVMIFPVLQHLRFSNIIAADRFTYLPFIGLVHPIAVWVSQKYNDSATYLQRTIAVGGVLLLAVLFVLTMERVTVWNNSDTLWHDVLLKYPHALQ
jgi:hypothetical protein